MLDTVKLPEFEQVTSYASILIEVLKKFYSYEIKPFLLIR